MSLVIPGCMTRPEEARSIRSKEERNQNVAFQVFTLGQAGRDSRTFQASCAFGQVLSPRVFLTQVCGRRRIGQGREKKFHCRWPDQFRKQEQGNPEDFDYTEI